MSVTVIPLGGRRELLWCGGADTVSRWTRSSSISWCECQTQCAKRPDEAVNGRVRLLGPLTKCGALPSHANRYCGGPQSVCCRDGKRRRGWDELRLSHYGALKSVHREKTLALLSDQLITRNTSSAPSVASIEHTGQELDVMRQRVSDRTSTHLKLRPLVRRRQSEKMSKDGWINPERG